MSVDRVTEMVGKNKSTISRYENGITNMTVEVLFKLLDVYHLLIVDVVTKDGDGCH
ncbi:MAG: helix-turn-helix transcriptional regulator [Selenomonas sp.]|nr:helix-turn-helix transcriptional regulator [Selenomonas sp.]